jgi:hypothetical protein
MEDETPEVMSLFPSGIEIFPPDEENFVAIGFPTSDDAIIFYEFLKSFVTAEITLEITGRGS